LRSAIVIILLLLIAVAAISYYALNPRPSPNPNPPITGRAIAPPPVTTTPPSTSGISTTSSSTCGDYGQPCCPDSTCNQGECQGGMCIHCGYFGETCCFNSVDGTQCEYGSDCISGRCQVNSDYNYYNECGHIGYPVCADDYGAYCNYGVVSSATGICIACGDYEQPCCPNTDYECDYGQCIGGICKRVKSTPASSTTSSSSSSSSASSSSSSSSSTTTSTSNAASSTNCGYLDQDCCVTEVNDPFAPAGMPRLQYYCENNLECRAGICVEGPDFQAYDRTIGGYS